jgi:5-methylcytosine-specific restriction endonuclease McrA
MLGGHRYHEAWIDRGNRLGVSMRWDAVAALHVLRRQFGDFDPERSLWEADHIVPVVLGGGCCDLANLRTLCQRCHKLETRRLAATRVELRRAAHRRPVQRGLL